MVYRKRRGLFRKVLVSLRVIINKIKESPVKTKRGLVGSLLLKFSRQYSMNIANNYSLLNGAKVGNYTQKTKIDSLKLYLRLPDLEYLHPEIIEGKILVSRKEVEDGFDIEKKEFIRKRVSDNDLETLSFKLVKWPTEEVLEIMFSAKLLRERYLEGVTRSNVKEVYNLINKSQWIGLSEETFMKARVSDIDLCRDFITESLDHYQRYRNLVKGVLKDEFHYKAFNKALEGNVGLLINNRGRYAKSINYERPFVNMYWKEGELLTKSYGLNRRYLGLNLERRVVEIGPNGEDQVKIFYKNQWQLCRLEVNVANKRILRKIFKNYGMEHLTPNNLEEFLEIPDQLLDELYYNRLTINFDEMKLRKVYKADMRVVKRKVLSFEEQMFYGWCLDLMASKKYTKPKDMAEDMLRVMDDGSLDKQKRYRWKVKLVKFAEKVILEKKRNNDIEYNESLMSEFMSCLGLEERYKEGFEKVEFWKEKEEKEIV